MAQTCRFSRLLSAGLCLVLLASVAYWKYSHQESEVDNHRIRKRQSDAEVVLESDEVSDNTDETSPGKIKEIAEFVELPPGQLICHRRKKSKIPPARLTEGLEDTDEVLEEDIIFSLTKKSPIRISLSSLNPHRPIGCCPPGDPGGQMYRAGYGCCGDEVYNRETHFCCVSKRRVLEDNAREKGYCYPASGIPFCRERDLDMESKSPMTKKCKYNEYNTPTACYFVCPSGMIPTEGITDTNCTETGVWNKQPTCCEGCPSTLKLDLWFIIEVSQHYGKLNFKLLTNFLKETVAYMPVSQNGVRVGVTIFNRVVFYDVGVWYMNAHNSHDSINDAIDEIPMEGTGVNTGAALTWIVENAFTQSKGNREDVENFAVVMLNGQPEDAFIEPARKLKELSKVMAIAIGDEVTNDDLSAIASSVNDVHRSESFEKLKDLSKLLYKSVCGENCKDDSGS